MTKKKTRRNYKREDGTRIPSVTEIVKKNIGWGQERLIGWANKVGREGLTTHKASLDKKNAGTLCHDWIESFLEGCAPNITHKPEDYTETAWALAVTSWCGFMQLWERESLGTRLKVLHAERALIDPDERFAGTPDLVAELDGEKIILDYKTGSTIGPDVLLQLGGYARLLARCGEEVPAALGVIHVPSNGAPPSLFITRKAHFLMGAHMQVMELDALRETMADMAAEVFADG